jgi:D-alanyl-D-alanine carboxypeptidase/D-alanyl-D-alanine-endopeptidase (penicillin-binding protein 4)
MTLLRKMATRPAFPVYLGALPALGVDGSLASVGRIPFDPLIATAFDEVFAKTGTTVDASGLKAQAFAGYIDAASGRRLAYVVYVNDVTTISQIADVIEVFADEGRISALLRAAS